MKNYTVFGLQRSGTNFLETIIQKVFFDVSKKNLDINYIWKHSYQFNTTRIKKDHLHFFITKSPYCWIESIIKKRVDIIKRTPSLQIDENSFIIKSNLDILKLAQHWKNHTLWFFEIKKNNIFDLNMIRYEDILKKEKYISDIFFNISKNYNIKIKEYFSEINLPNKVNLSDVWEQQKSNLYINEKIKILTYDNIYEINKILEDEIFTLTGYKKINTEEQYNIAKIK